MPITGINFEAFTAKDLDAENDPSLAEFNRKLAPIYEAVNRLMGARGPIQLVADLDMGGNRIKNLGVPKAASDALSQTSADPIYGTAVQRKTMEAVGTQMLQTTRRLGDGSQQHKTSGDLKAQGSIPPSVNGQVTYTATSTSITWSFPASFQFADGTIVQIPNIPVTVTGLVNGTPYKFYPYYDANIGLGQFVADPVNAIGVPPIAFATTNANAAQAQNADGRIPLSVGAVIGTPSPGGSGSGGGSNCLWAGMILETRSRGIVLSKFVERGEIIRKVNGWTKVIAKQMGVDRVFVRVQLSNGEEVRVTPMDEVGLFGGSMKEAMYLSLSDVMVGVDASGKKTPLQIVGLSPWLGDAETVLLTVDDPEHEFMTGILHPSVVLHNNLVQK